MMAYNLVLSIDQALAGDFAAVAAKSQRQEPLWALFNQHGASIRVIAVAASAPGGQRMIACHAHCVRCRRRMRQK
ncbi:hypothetical protein ACRQ84_19875 (plasmid) [Enterobacter ludwigii]